MYKHTVQYYETDKMGITHHSNYIRWMEEARVDFLKNIGYGYDRLEEEGVISPVISINCNYKQTTSFPDVIGIDVKVLEFKGVKLKLFYEMKNEKGQIVCTCESAHCFLDDKGNPVRLQKVLPEFYELLTNLQQ